MSNKIKVIQNLYCLINVINLNKVQKQTRPAFEDPTEEVEKICWTCPALWSFHVYLLNLPWGGGRGGRTSKVSTESGSRFFLLLREVIRCRSTLKNFWCTLNSSGSGLPGLKVERLKLDSDLKSV